MSVRSTMPVAQPDFEKLVREQYELDDLYGRAYEEMEGAMTELVAVRDPGAVNDDDDTKIVELKIATSHVMGKWYLAELYAGSEEFPISQYRFIVQHPSETGPASFYLYKLVDKTDLAPDDFSALELPLLRELVQSQHPRVLHRLLQRAKFVGLLDDSSPVVVRITTPPGELDDAQRAWLEKILHQYEILGFDYDDDGDRSIVWSTVGRFFTAYRPDLRAYKENMAAATIDELERRFGPMYSVQRNQERRHVEEIFLQAQSNQEVDELIAKYAQRADRARRRAELEVRREIALGVVDSSDMHVALRQYPELDANGKVGKLTLYNIRQARRVHGYNSKQELRALQEEVERLESSVQARRAERLHLNIVNWNDPVDPVYELRADDGASTSWEPLPPSPVISEDTPLPASPVISEDRQVVDLVSSSSDNDIQVMLSSSTSPARKRAMVDLTASSDDEAPPPPSSVAAVSARRHSSRPPKRIYRPEMVNWNDGIRLDGGRFRDR